MLDLRTTLAREEFRLDGQTLFIRELTAVEREDYEMSMFQIVDNKVVPNLDKHIKARLVLACVVREDGSKYFTDLQSIDQLPGSVVKALFDRAAKLSGVDREATESAGND